MVHVDRIAKQFGPQVVFQGISWRIPRGARLGLVGPNGAGKTTLLRILAGEDAPDAGEVHRTGSLTVGYLPQEVETIREGTVLRVVLDGASEVVEVERRLRALEAELAQARAGDPKAEAATAAYGDLRHRFGDVPRRLLVALGDAQEELAGSGEASRERQVDERAEGMPEPAARELRPVPPGRERHMLSLVKAIEHQVLIAELPHCRMALRPAAILHPCASRGRSSPFS